MDISQKNYFFDYYLKHIIISLMKSYKNINQKNTQILFFYRKQKFKKKYL